jgi:hypothetical protein
MQSSKSQISRPDPGSGMIIAAEAQPAFLEREAESLRLRLFSKLSERYLIASTIGFNVGPHEFGDTQIILLLFSLFEKGLARIFIVEDQEPKKTN